MGSFLDELLNEAPAILVFVILGTGILGLFLGISWAWMIFAIGFVVVLPLVAILSDAIKRATGTPDWYERKVRDGTEEGKDPQQDALDTLRDRYARGEIDEEEFERRVNLLLENETIGDVKARQERERERN
ncbi:SHOCT domain-containing protein [Haladaptatus sp. DYF46]|uniref:SHOCT domain-containing protein n=1 Tax=Haladaptatus sp. DYF46 TaxID=2886041 RepID=UPI001E53120D|nr:SHOCT domain-containing protein [Haladaptatus sp. DYF46]